MMLADGPAPITVFAPVQFVSYDNGPSKSARVTSEELTAALRKFEEGGADKNGRGNVSVFHNAQQVSTNKTGAAPMKKSARKKFKMQFMGNRLVVSCSKNGEKAVRSRVRQEEMVRLEEDAEQQAVFATLQEIQEQQRAQAAELQRTWLPQGSSASQAFFRKKRQNVRSQVDSGWTGGASKSYNSYQQYQQSADTVAASETPQSGTFTPANMSGGELLATPPIDFPPNSMAASVSRMVNDVLEEQSAASLAASRTPQSGGLSSTIPSGVGGSKVHGLDNTMSSATTPNLDESPFELTLTETNVSETPQQQPSTTATGTTGQEAEETNSVASGKSKTNSIKSTSTTTTKTSGASGAGGGARVRDVARGNKKKKNVTKQKEVVQQPQVPAEYYTFHHTRLCPMPMDENGVPLSHMEVVKRERELRIQKRNKEQAEAFELHQKGMMAEREWNTMLTKMEVERMMAQNNVVRKNAASLARAWLNFKEEEKRENELLSQEQQVDAETLHADNRWMRHIKDGFEEDSSTNSDDDGYSKEDAEAKHQKAEVERTKVATKNYVDGFSQEMEDAEVIMQKKSLIGTMRDREEMRKKEQKELEKSAPKRKKKKKVKKADKKEKPTETEEATEEPSKDDVQTEQQEEDQQKEEKAGRAAVIIQCCVRVWLALRRVRDSRQALLEEWCAEEAAELAAFSEEGGFTDWSDTEDQEAAAE
eukprot:TRINITY_DN59456_c0_g1_i1.p1 TRINITY_DN59456_c0_g1~~TRINITY_DN59456_c0_g1_i1.p1  ORF type:complete len:706 (-),score=117.68 TRINITY_DN59456_c0_g1_i1:382-2499(-)